MTGSQGEQADAHLPSQAGLRWMAMLRMLIIFTLLGLVVGLSSAAMAQGNASPAGFAPIPPLRAPVTDTAGLLNAAQREALNNVLREREARTGNQIAVLTVASTAPEAIEQYGIRVAEAWQIGRKGVDDGVILIIARDNPSALRRLRIEAGRGVQGSLTDVQSKRILQDVIAPHFRQNDFYGGLTAGISAISALLDQERFPAPQRQSEPAAVSDSGWGLLPILLFALFFLLPLFTRRRGHSLRRDQWGHSAGVILGSAIGSRIGHGGYGGYGGSGGFGSSGGFGGFSGGGGTFDGGGASGDW